MTDNTVRHHELDGALLGKVTGGSGAGGRKYLMICKNENCRHQRIVYCEEGRPTDEQHRCPKCGYPFSAAFEC